MFRNLLSPLRSAGFENLNPLSPRSGGSVPGSTSVSPEPEDLAHGVRMDVMRRSAEELKEGAGTLDLVGLTELLEIIRRVMIEDHSTVAIFIELDGLLGLLSALQIVCAQVQTMPSPTRRSPPLPDRSAPVTAVKSALQVLDGVLKERSGRAGFETSRGWETLTTMLLPLGPISGVSTSLLGDLLCLSLADFSPSNLEFFAASAKPAFNPFATATLHNPEAISTMLALLPNLVSFSERVALASVLLQIAQSGPFNLAAMAQPEIDLLGQLIPLLFPAPEGASLAAPVSSPTSIGSPSSLSSSRSTYKLEDNLRPLLLKLMKLLLRTSCSVPSARMLFERAVHLEKGQHIDTEVLGVLADGCDTMSDGFGWPAFLSLADGSAQTIVDRAVGGSGFTFLAWIYLPRINVDETRTLMTLSPNPPVSSRFSVRISLRSDCSISYETSASKGPVRFSKSRIRRCEWVQLGLTHWRSDAKGESKCYVFLNGHLTESLPTPWPRVPSSLQFQIGRTNASDAPKDCCIYVGPCHLLAYPLANEMLVLPRILGPHYTGKFQAGLLRFLTYAAATGLNVHLAAEAQSKNEAEKAAGKGKAKDKEKETNVAIMKALRDGLHTDSAPVHVMVPARSFLEDMADDPNGGASVPGSWTLENNAKIVELLPLRSAVYAIGGSSLGLRLVEFAKNEAELLDALRVLLGILAHSWRNSEEMESYNGYDVVSSLLRKNPSFISEAVLDVILSFVGIDRQNVNRCVIVNTVAYRALLLDFDLWARTALPIQRLYLSHFTLLVSGTTHRRFNIKHRFAKYGIIRLFLHSLRFTPYQDDIIPDVIDAMRSIMLYHFSTEHTIKPLVSYLATNLHPESESVISPLSTISVLPDNTKGYVKALKVFDMLLSILHMFEYIVKFNVSLTISRVALLLLGEEPSPEIASRVLTLLGLVSRISPTFPRKFELVHGWLVLRHVLPQCWEPSVQKASFDLLLGQAKLEGKRNPEEISEEAYCLSVLPAILASFFVSIERSFAGLLPLAETSTGEDVSESLADALLELLDGHPQLFRSKNVITLFTQFAHNILATLPSPQEQQPLSRSLIDKLTHITVMLSLDERIATTQRQELTRLLQRLHSSGSHSAAVTPQSTPISAKSIDTHGLGTVQQSFTRTAAWRANLRKMDKDRIRKHLQDDREWREQIAQQIIWRSATDFDRGLWISPGAVRTWKVDETEGPFRTRYVLLLLSIKSFWRMTRRKKLEAMEQEQTSAQTKNGPSDSSALQISASDRRLHAMDLDDSASVTRVEPPPWNDNESNLTPELSLEEDLVDDKHRRVRRYLAPGDVIQAVTNVYRIVGIDSSPGLLILGKTHLYLLEGLVASKDGEIIDAREAPKDLLVIPSGTVVEFKKYRPADKWAFEDITGLSKRTCLFRDVALELYLRDNRSILLVFETSQARQSAFSRLAGSRSGKPPAEAASAFPLRTPLASAMTAVGARFTMIGTGRAELETATRKWQARELSNFAYLAIINQAAGRTPNDITQYPVYPWILQDYDSEKLDLTSPETFRDLACPMGALTPDRRSSALERYDAQMGEQPFHYGTHFSSSMIVCHFLLRLQPFTRMFQELQGGSFDLAERLFRDVGKAWSSAAHESRGDVRELIPEFFTCPEFLQNVNELDLGTLHTGERVGDVTLPVWAMKDPLLFISLHRQALESDHVSKCIPRWIDLVFGIKQKDVEALNVYHPLTYEGAIDLEAITDAWEREATVGAIHNFGQTPRQVFRHSHPDRYLEGKTTLPLGTPFGICEDYGLLKQGNPIGKKILESVDTLYIDTIAERIVACPAHKRSVPQMPHEYIEWSELTHSVSFFVDRKVSHIEEETPITVAEFYDNRVLVTGSDDSTVSIWRIVRGDQFALRLVGSMRGHHGRVNCLATSRSWAMAVTGAADGLVILWDVNRVRYVRSMAHEMPVEHVQIGPGGEIASSSRTAVSLHTMNGQLIASFRPMEPITCLAFHEREYTPTPVLVTACADEIKLWTWNATSADEEGKAVWKFVPLRTMKCKNGLSPNTSVKALQFVGESLYHGDSDGNIFLWTFPE
ncbi:beach-domain-containing protein [Dacryopinax primogenitus]|uniref:Beach-domain-containing protein n=1 Tax=Dacryopinax primogenitus (strain DJM 731) TaxID=1858805 RepID=M5G0N8_DACPD|nr:beach-domain-containing protein [Dacryopinax primogenitus]EJT97367.1 beach-domain-containing protein [Dacryopinax primogenitus]